MSGLVAWFAISFFTKRLNTSIRNQNVVTIIAVILHFAFFFKFMQVRANSENWATSFFLISFAISIKDSKLSAKELILISLFSGVSFLLRHQLGLMVLPMCLHLLISKSVKIGEWLKFILIPMLAVLLFGLLIDSFGYNTLSYSPWNYVYQNLILGKVNNFGTHSVFAYTKWIIIKLSPFFGVPLILGFFYYLTKKKSSIYLWTTLPFIIIHHLIGHKELRFLYPIAPLATVMAVDYFHQIKLSKNKYFLKFARVIFFINIIAMLFVISKSAYTPMKFYQYLYNSKHTTLNAFPDRKGNYPSLEMEFYKKKDFEIIKAQTPIEKIKGSLFTTRMNELRVLMGRRDCDIEYISYPKWILKYNYFNWTSRSNIWAITSCH